MIDTARELAEHLSRLRFDSSLDAPHVALRQAVVDAYRAAVEGDVTLDFFDDDWSAAPQLDEAALLEAPPHLLLAWCDDLDGAGATFIPLETASEPLRQLASDARTVNGLCFADGSDCSPPQLAAAIRLLAALQHYPADDIYAGWQQELQAYAPNEGSIRSPADLAPYVQALRGSGIGRPEQFLHRVVEVCAVNKAS